MNTIKILVTIGGSLVIICLLILTITYSVHISTASTSAPPTALAPTPIVTPAQPVVVQPAAPVIVQPAAPVIVQPPAPVIVQQPQPVIVQQAPIPSAPVLDGPFSNFVARYGSPFQNPYGQTCFWYDSHQIVNICVATNNNGIVTWIQAGDNDLNVTGADTDAYIANFITNRDMYQYIPVDGASYSVTADGLNSTTMTY